ncbi:MAG: hypothetical protein LC734_01420 [Acidobacteria bacterium]|nr:hypothetical protein [Acidobacteriota bacterium]
MLTKTFYEDLKTFDGVRLPTRMRSVLPSHEIIMTVTSLKANVPVDDVKFARPKS